MIYPPQSGEFKYFSSKDEATERTLRALGNVGFKIARDTAEIDDVRVNDYTHDQHPDNWDSGRSRVSIAGLHVDADTNNQVSIGMNINGGELGWPYDWYARSTTIGVDPKILNQGGNHDTHQLEFLDQMTLLLGSAHFDVEAGRLPSHTDEFKQWAAQLAIQLDPIYSDSL